MKTKPVQITPEAHQKYSDLKQESGKTFKRLVENGADALEILPRLIAAVESDKPMKLNRVLAEAKSIV